MPCTKRTAPVTARCAANSFACSTRWPSLQAHSVCFRFYTSNYVAKKSVTEIYSVAADKPQMVEAEQLATWTERDMHLRVAGRVKHAAIQQLTGRPAPFFVGWDDASGPPTPETRPLFPTWIASESINASGLLLMLAAFLLPVGVLLGWRSQHSPKRLGVLGQISAWLIGLGLSFAICGLAPAEVVSRTMQGWILAVIAAGVALGATWQAYRFLRRWDRRFRLSSILTVMFVLAVVSSLSRFWWPFTAAMVEQPWVPARGASDLSAEALRVSLEMPAASASWALLQWLLYSGPLVCVAISLSLIALLTVWRCRVADGRGAFCWWVPHARLHWATLATNVAKSSLVGCAILLMPFLWFAPVVIEEQERQFQQSLARGGDIDTRWRELQKKIAEIEASAETMQKFRTAAEREVNSTRSAPLAGARGELPE